MILVIRVPDCVEFNKKLETFLKREKIIKLIEYEKFQEDGKWFYDLALEVK